MIAKIEKAELKESLKEQIFKREKKMDYNSDKFDKIKEKVTESLRSQRADDALNDLTTWALFVWSSDIHYEVYEDTVFIRFRIDGILIDIFQITSKEYKALLERLKYGSGLKLNITNIPQDWKYFVKLDGDHKIDVRVSTLPTKYGENVVSRILDNKKNIVDFEKLWFFWTGKRLIENAIKKKNGMILVTWPTWSWKTTTLYTILATLNTREKKIMTLEDPIEYEVRWIIQSEVNEKNGFTFETWLKALLRQDPDIIMVWEIRDYETLNTATSASLTWHLVLSTLHTKSASETLDRIINMWIKPYIIASALDVIIAQRLVRKICPDCKVEKEKKVQEIAIMKTMMEEIGMKWIPIKNMKLYTWIWCDSCWHSWYKWRIWIFEIINLSTNIKDLIRSWASSDEIFREARNGNLVTMREDGILKAMWWYITIEELLRVI